ncbi:hypothetical protein FACHB389_05885 [Nostoc calcicola FACHB-389]|nr:hypothetical protein FACHB389_05885 [Nostoc calcicola FACHB-389]
MISSNCARNKEYSGSHSDAVQHYIARCREQSRADFSRDLENLSLNLSPTRRETLNLPPSLVGKGVRGLGFSLAFPHDVKSQHCRAPTGVPQ